MMVIINFLRLLILLFFTTYSFSQKVDKKSYLKIVYDFLQTELKQERYKNYPISSYDWCLVGDTGYLIGDYEAEYKQIKMASKNFVRDSYFPIDSISIERIKKKNESLNFAPWEVNDFPNYNFKIIKQELIRDNIKSGVYTDIRPMLVISISVPLFINKNLFIIGFTSQDTKLGSEMIRYFSALMVRKNGKWEKKYEYFNGVYY